MSGNIEESVASHYSRPELLDTILRGVAAAGADPDNLTPADLAPVDEFHTAGRATTLMALSKLSPRAGMHVLDVGCGIGGTARCLAHEHGCRVTGIDLTPDYVAVATALTQRMGLADVCHFEVGSATRLPFADDAFDAAVTFHVAMNIEDRAALYSGIARVLKPGASLCLFDVMKGPGEGMSYPVPWAQTEATSFLRSRDETAALLRDAGFEMTAEENLREFAIGFFRDAFAKMAKSGGPPPLGLHLLTGPDAPAKFQNYAKALDAHQIEPVIMVARLR